VESEGHEEKYRAVIDGGHPEIPVHSRPRRLVDWINPTGAKKVHSLIDKVYQRKNLEMAWEMVKANRGRDSARRCGFTLAQQHTSDAVRSGDAAQGISAYEVRR
jgi:hypothetical protein